MPGKRMLIAVAVAAALSAGVSPSAWAESVPRPEVPDGAGGGAAPSVPSPCVGSIEKDHFRYGNDMFLYYRIHHAAYMGCAVPVLMSGTTHLYNALGNEISRADQAGVPVFDTYANTQPYILGTVTTHVFDLDITLTDGSVWANNYSDFCTSGAGTPTTHCHYSQSSAVASDTYQSFG